MFSSEPLLKNRLAINRAELRSGPPASNACQLESNWATLNRWRWVRGVWGAGGPQCQRWGGEFGGRAAVTGTKAMVQLKFQQKLELISLNSLTYVNVCRSQHNLTYIYYTNTEASFPQKELLTPANKHTSLSVCSNCINNAPGLSLQAGQGVWPGGIKMLFCVFVSHCSLVQQLPFQSTWWLTFGAGHRLWPKCGMYDTHTHTLTHIHTHTLVKLTEKNHIILTFLCFYL